MAANLASLYAGFFNPQPQTILPPQIAEELTQLRNQQRQLLIERIQRSRQVKKAFLLDIIRPKKAKRKNEQHLLIVRPGEDPKVFSLDEDKEKVKFLYNIERGQFREMVRSLGDC